jgi:hypothetical protein
LEGVKALMRISKNWIEFVEKMDMVYPNLNATLQLPFDDVAGALPAPKPVGAADSVGR